MYSTSKMIGKISLNEKLHKYLQELASKPGVVHFIKTCRFVIKIFLETKNK